MQSVRIHLFVLFLPLVVGCGDPPTEPDEPPPESANTQDPVAPAAAAPEIDGSGWVQEPIPDEPEQLVIATDDQGQPGLSGTTTPGSSDATNVAGTGPLSVSAAQVARGVENRQPVGSGPFQKGMKVWTWSRIANPQDTPRQIKHIYYHEGTAVHAQTLAVKGPNYRTHSYKTVGSKGSWRVDIVDEAGRVMKSLPFVVE